MAENNGLFDIKKAVADNSEKRGYAEGVQYYYNMIRNNASVIASDEFPIVIKFGNALDDLIKLESSTALVDLTTIFPEFYDEEGLKEVFQISGLDYAFDNISEFLMLLSHIYHLDYYQ